MTSSQDPEEYVKNNRHELIKIVKHSSNTFPRALAVAALVEYGNTPDVEGIISELERFEDNSD